MQKEERQRNELKKQELYDTNIFVNKERINNVSIQEEPVELIEYKENIFKKIINKIKQFFTWK